MRYVLPPLLGTIILTVIAAVGLRLAGVVRLLAGIAMIVVLGKAARRIILEAKATERA